MLNVPAQKTIGQLFRRYRNRVTAAVRIAKCMNNRNLIQETMHNPRHFWTAIKKMLPSKTTSSGPISQIKSEGQILTDKMGIANAVCKFLSSVKSWISEAYASTWRRFNPL